MRLSPPPRNSAQPRSTRELKKFSQVSVIRVASMIAEIERISDPVEETTRACTTVLAKVSELDRQVT
jgi:methyl-accepting chemotaxis protein